MVMTLLNSVQRAPVFIYHCIGKGRSRLLQGLTPADAWESQGDVRLLTDRLSLTAPLVHTMARVLKRVFIDR